MMEARLELDVDSNHVGMADTLSDLQGIQVDLSINKNREQCFGVPTVLDNFEGAPLQYTLILNRCLRQHIAILMFLPTLSYVITRYPTVKLSLQ
jgi:hypothetical protein